MKMAKYVLPDPKDRSENDPCIIMDTKKVLGLYNQAHEEEEMQKVMPKVQEWTIKEAKDNGWDDARFIGSQCLLETKFDKDTVLPLVPERHQIKLNEHDTVYATGYRRTRHGEQQLELRFDGIAGCLRTPEGGSSKQYLVVKKNDEIHARLLTVREAARLMGAPDSFILPGSYNDGYKAMGDAVAMPVAQFIGENFLTKLAEAVYDD